MVRINSVSSVVASHEVSVEDIASFLSAYAPVMARSRLRRVLDASGNRRRRTVLPLGELARLGGATERSELYRRHAAILAARAVTELADRQMLAPERITTVVFVSSTGSSAPSIDTELVRRFGMNERCRRIALTQLGCGGGVAALSLAAEIVSRDSAQRVLVVSVEVPSLQLQLGEPSYLDLVAASQFGDGAAAAVVSTDASGPEVLGTESVLLPQTDEGGRILPSETGLRLAASGGLPQIVSSRVGDLVSRFARAHGVDPRGFSFLIAHPRGGAVLDAIAEGLSAAGLSLDASFLRPSRLAWEYSANMVSASIYRAFAELVRIDPPSDGDLGMLLAFGVGVACEMTLLRWRTAPTVAYS